MDKRHGLSGQQARVDEVRVKLEDSPLRLEDQMTGNGHVRKRRITGQEKSGLSVEQIEPTTTSQQFTWDMKRDLQTNVEWGDGQDFIKLVQEGLTYGQLISLCRPLNDSDIPLLLKAADAGNLSVIKLLVESFGSMRNTGTFVASSDFDLSKALIHAVKCKKKRKSKGIIRYLLDEGARLDIRDEEDSNLLHIACAHENEEAAKILLHAPSKLPHNFCFLTDKDKKNRTPLNLAIEKNHFDLAKVIIQACTTLLELNAYTGHEESDNNTMVAAHNQAGDDLHPEPSLHLACQYGRIEIVDMILKAEKKLANVEKSQLLNLFDCENRTPLQLAIENKHAEVAVRCCEEGADLKLILKKQHRQTLFLYISAAGATSCVGALLDLGVEVDGVDELGDAPLYLAAANGHSGVCEALIDRGADIEKRNKNGYWPLLIAAKCGHHHTVKTLLQKGANILATDSNGRSALHFATLKNDAETVEVLMDQIKESNFKASWFLDSNRNTPLHYAAEYGKTEAMQVLCRYPRQMGFFANCSGLTALHLAAMKGHISEVQYLVRAHGTATLVNTIEPVHRFTALHLAAQAGENQIIRILVEGGNANIEAKARINWPDLSTSHLLITPLHYAASRGLLETCELLLDLGADVSSQPKRRKQGDGYEVHFSPLHLACYSGNPQVVSLLIERGASVTCITRGTSLTYINCLDLAIYANQTENALAVIRSDRWREALMNEGFFQGTSETTIMAKLVKVMPVVAREVLDNCLELTPQERKQEQPREQAREQSGVDTKTGQNQDEVEFEDSDILVIDRLNLNQVPGGNAKENEEEFSFNDEFISDEEWRKALFKDRYGRIVSEKLSPNGRMLIVKKRDCLRQMIRHNRVELLSHPLVRILLLLKWRRFGRVAFFLNLLSYVAFLFFLNGYVLSTAFMAPHQYKDLPILQDFKGTDCERIRQHTASVGPVAVISTFGRVCGIGTWSLAILLLLKEVIQIPFSGLVGYLSSAENYIEWFIYLTVILLLFDIEQCQTETGLRLDWQWQLGALSVFWSWINLLLFIRRLPVFGLYVVMFTTILKSFLLFLPVLVLFIVAFAISFYCLLANQVSFRYEMTSIIKTFVMMIGEMDYGNMFDDRAVEQRRGVMIWYEAVTYIQFALFLVVMAILVMNLLVGLAVDDIQEVVKQSQQQMLALQGVGILDKLRRCETQDNFTSSSLFTLKRVALYHLKKPIYPSYDQRHLAGGRYLITMDLEAEFLLDCESVIDGVLSFLKKCFCGFGPGKDATTCINQDIVKKGPKYNRICLRRTTGPMAKIARNWVLSETAIVEEWYNSRQAIHDKTDEEVSRIPGQIESLARKNKELQESLETVKEQSKLSARDLKEQMKRDMNEMKERMNEEFCKVAGELNKISQMLEKFPKT